MKSNSFVFFCLCNRNCKSKMSAESPKRIARSMPSVVPPEPVNDCSIIESVTGFINEVTLNSVPQIDQKEQIQWVNLRKKI